MPLTKLQSDILGTLAAHRSPDSYIAGGIALNRFGPRYSEDISQDSEERLLAAAAEDEFALREQGFEFRWVRTLILIREAEIGRGGEHVRLEWVYDSAFRFFPAATDELFGYVLHPADLATNKVSAAADRRAPRDVVDLLTIHDNVLPLGAAISAAVGRFPGQTPEQTLADIRRHSRFTADEFNDLITEVPISPLEIGRRIREMLESAEQFIERLPSDLVGFLFLENGCPVQPDLANLSKYELRTGSVGGIWPSSPEIWNAMYQRYRDSDR